jgi:hypothetical protein
MAAIPQSPQGAPYYTNGLRLQADKQIIRVRPHGQPASQGFAVLHTLDSSLAAGGSKGGQIIAGQVWIEGALYRQLYRQPRMAW